MTTTKQTSRKAPILAVSIILLVSVLVMCQAPVCCSEDFTSKVSELATIYVETSPRTITTPAILEDRLLALNRLDYSMLSGVEYDAFCVRKLTLRRAGGR